MFMVAYVNGVYGISDSSRTLHLFPPLVAQPERRLLLCRVRPSLRSRPLKLGLTLVAARNSPTQKHGCQPCHRVRRKRRPGLQVCAAFQVERMGERE